MKKIFSKKSTIFLLLFLPVAFAAIFSQSSFADSRTISFAKNYDSKISFSSYFRRYTKAIASDGSKVIYSFEPIIENINISRLENPSVPTTGNIKFLSEDGDFLTLSIGKVKLTACIENTTICISREITIYPEEVYNLAGDRDYDAYNTYYFYFLNDQEIEESLGETLKVDDFLNETFEKTSESFANLKVTNISVSEEKTTEIQETASSTRVWNTYDLCTLDGNYLNCNSYHPRYIFHTKKITTNITAETYPPLSPSEEEPEEYIKEEDVEDESEKELEKESESEKAGKGQGEKISSDFSEPASDISILAPNTGSGPTPEKTNQSLSCSNFLTILVSTCFGLIIFKFLCYNKEN